MPDNAGLGEREARIVSQIVARRHFRLGHGVGRSGDIAAIQPKAAGSSLLARIAERMALDLLKMSGATRTKACIVLPVATGMSIVLTLLTLKADKPDAKYVLWHRIDQKTCFKAIITAGAGGWNRFAKCPSSFLFQPPTLSSSWLTCTTL